MLQPRNELARKSQKSVVFARTAKVLTEGRFVEGAQLSRVEGGALAPENA